VVQDRCLFSCLLSILRTVVTGRVGYRVCNRVRLRPVRFSLFFRCSFSQQKDSDRAERRRGERYEWRSNERAYIGRESNLLYCKSTCCTCLARTESEPRVPTGCLAAGFSSDIGRESNLPALAWPGQDGTGRESRASGSITGRSTHPRAGTAVVLLVSNRCVPYLRIYAHRMEVRTVRVDVGREPGCQTSCRNTTRVFPTNNVDWVV
jgi:hypothetical protein